MIAGIITTPNRQKYLPALLRVIAPFASKTTLFNDLGLQGTQFNLARCLRDMLALPPAATGEPVLITADDMIAPPNWFQTWSSIHAEVQHDIYVLFGRQRHHFTDENLRRGYTLPKVHRGGFYDAAFIIVNRPLLFQQVTAWYATGPEVSARVRFVLDHSKNSYDLMIQEYLVQHSIPWVITTPTLFEHVGQDASVMRHRIGGSPCYAGDPAVIERQAQLRGGVHVA